jgi:octaprenyl-diphosphate synthase
MDFSKIFELAGGELEKVEKELYSSLTSELPAVNELVMGTVKSGGKRIRPLVLILSAGMCGYSGDLIPKLGVALEYIHTSSLLHDDVIDEAMTRRGKPSAKAIYGNNITVLSGDYLYANAFHNLAKLEERDFAVIISAAVASMSEGEIFQLQNMGNISLTMNDYLKVIYGKTSALFAAACECGGILGNVGAAGRKSLYDYGCNVGYAFQMQDDVLDYFGVESVIGKKPGTDLGEKKVTLPMMLLLQEAGVAEKAEIEKIFLSDDEPEARLALLLTIFDTYRIAEKAKNKVQEYIDTAVSMLAGFPESQYKDSLIFLTSGLNKRNS